MRVEQHPILRELKKEPLVAIEVDRGDRDLIICRCEEVSRGEILQAIREGARTANEVKRRTRAGMGLCQGKTCSRSVRRIIAEQTGQAIGEVLPPTFRPPVRPVMLGLLASLDQEEEENVP